MFWISYCITFVLALAIAIALMVMHLVHSAIGKVFGSSTPLNERSTVSRWSRSIRKAD